MGVGIASDKKLISLDDSVISFFPDKLPETISENLQKMKVKHLLSMTCGIHENTYGMLYNQDDWVKAFLAQDFPHEPGTYYRYSTHASHVLAAIIEKVAGMSFHEFLKINLFEPLGIAKSTWEHCKQGITAGGMGLGLTTESIAKFGQMLLNKGIFNGKRILSEEYVTAMITEQSNDRILEKSKHRNGYGYQMQIGHDGSFNHPGGFGTLCYVSTHKNIVIAATSRKKNYEEIMDLIQEKFIEPPGCCQHSDMSYDYKKLIERIDTLTYPTPEFMPIPHEASRLYGSYIINDNPHGLVKISFEENGQNSLIMYMHYLDRESSTLQFNFTKPVEGYDIFVKDILFHKQKYVSYAAWITPSLLRLTITYLETPYVVTYDILLADKI